MKAQKTQIKEGAYFEQKFGISIDDKLSKIIARVNKLNSKDFEY